MKTLYIDYDFNVHIENADGRTPIETDVFDGMPNQVIECYRFVPSGQRCKKGNGITVHGEFIQPFVTAKELDAAQREYERQQLAAYEQALSEIEAALGV